jgi:hypothetical protein
VGWMKRSAQGQRWRTRRLMAALCCAWLSSASLVCSVVYADPSAADRLALIIARVLSYERTLAVRAGAAVDILVLFR